MTLRWTATLVLLLGAGCASTGGVRLDMGRGAPLEYRPLTSTKPVKVSRESFEEALSQLFLEQPLALRPAQQGWLMRTSSAPPANTRWQHLMRKSFGGLCRPGLPKNDCLSLLDDVAGFSSTDKLVVALGLSLDPMRQSIAKAMEDTLSPQFFVAAISAGMVTWALLAANPEPVFTKAAAVVAAVMVIYLGVDAFIEVVKACYELKQATDRAVTFEELKEASERFGRVMGDQGTRVFILAVTVLMSRGTMGGASWVAARLPRLPHFTAASAVGASQVGIRLEAVGQVSTVAVVEGNLVISLAPTAVAMAAWSTGGGAASGGGGTGFTSFQAFKDAMGPAGPGKHWHHIVEQTPGNVERFGPQALHNTENVIAIADQIHRRVSGFYSSIQPFTGGKTVRAWLSTQSFEAQRAFGLKTLRDFGALP